MRNFKIIRNKITGNSEGLEVELSGHGIIADNYIVRNNKAGLFLFDTNDVKVWNNTFEANSRSLQFLQDERRNTNTATKDYVPWVMSNIELRNNVVTYADPTGANPPLTWRHVGFNNTKKALDYLKTRFPTVNKLLVSGFSAGGVASAAGFYQARRTLLPAKGYMLNDSGPTFPAPNATYKSRPLHDRIKTQWALSTLYSQLPATFNQNDFGSITDMLSTEFPTDQLAYTGYSSDYNFSRFSYERFYPGITKDTVLSYWRTDQANMVARASELLAGQNTFLQPAEWGRLER